MDERMREIFEQCLGHYFKADTLREVVRSTPGVPKEVIDVVIEALEYQAIKGEWADVFQTGMVLAAISQKMKSPAGKYFLREIYYQCNDDTRLPTIVRDYSPGAN